MVLTKLFMMAIGLVLTNSIFSSALLFRPAQAILRSANSQEFLLAARSSVRMLNYYVSPNYTTQQEVRELGESYVNINKAKELISYRRALAAACAIGGPFICLTLRAYP